MAAETRRRVTRDEPQSIPSSLADTRSSTSHEVEGEDRGEGVNGVNLEATQLERIQTQYALASASTQTPLRPASPPSKNMIVRHLQTRIIFPVQKFWRRQVSITVDHDACRDHLALERTFLSYLRTSLVFSTLGVVVAQLFRLQHVANPDSIFGYFRLGIPLAVLCQCSAVCSLLLGAFRTWRLQNAIVRGKAISGGFEVTLLGLGSLSIIVVFFVLLLAVEIRKEYSQSND